ncbi:MAG: hypothetical protein HZC01_03915 [Candidatus Kerfeldbacteria bacterium]|nr:hypothetical protein [Candidatus Kerfeldbacteria bacterium]
MSEKAVHIGQAIGFGWASIKKDFWYLIALSVIVAVVNGFPSMIDNDNNTLGLLGLLLSAWITSGMLRIVIDYVRGTKRELTDVFTQTKYFLRVFLGMIFLGIIFVVGLVLFIIPGIYLALKYSFTMYFIVDKDMSITDAMKASAHMTSGIKGSLFGLAMASFGVFILGAIAFGIGIFVAIPIVWLAYGYVYNSLLASVPAAQTVVASATPAKK